MKITVMACLPAKRDMDINTCHYLFLQVNMSLILYLFSIISCLLFTNYCLLATASCLLPTHYCLLTYPFFILLYKSFPAGIAHALLNFTRIKKVTHGCRKPIGTIQVFRQFP